MKADGWNQLLQLTDKWLRNHVDFSCRLTTNVFAGTLIIFKFLITLTKKWKGSLDVGIFFNNICLIHMYETRKKKIFIRFFFFFFEPKIEENILWVM